MVSKNNTFLQTNVNYLLTERDLKSLRVFCAAVQSSGFTAATKKLHLSKASVSRHIIEVEERLGVKLCERGPAGFKLTAAGAVALKATTKALQALDSIKQEIDAVNGVLTGPITIGIVEHILTDPSFMLPEALNELKKIAPKVVPEIIVLNHTELNQALRDRRVQIGIRGKYQKDRTFNYIPLFDEYHRLYVSKNVSNQTVLTLPLVHRTHPFVEEILADKKFTQGPSAGGLEAIATFIATGNFIGLLTEHYAGLINIRYPVKQVFHDIEFKNQICAITEASRSLPASAEIFLDILKNQHLSKKL